MSRIELHDGLEFDGRKVQKGGRPAKPSDIPERTEFPPGHPMRKALRAVPSGFPDSTVDESGDMVPVDLSSLRPAVEVDFD